MAKSKKFTSDDSPLVANPFAQLLGGGASSDEDDGEPAGEPELAEVGAQARAPKVEAPPKVKGRVVVRREKKGRGGKTVTMVEGLHEAMARDFLPRIKRELGCSGQAQGRTLVIGTSDHLRVQRWLDEAGVARTVLGN